MNWTDSQNLEGIVGWLNLKGEDDPQVTFFLSLKPDILNFNTRKKFKFSDIKKKLKPARNAIDIPSFSWSQFQYAAEEWLIARSQDDSAQPPRLIASGVSSHETMLSDTFDIQAVVPCVPVYPQDDAPATDTQNLVQGQFASNEPQGCK